MTLIYSILDGGFLGAVRHLRELEPSLSLSNALADSSVPVLEAVLSYNGGQVVHVPVPRPAGMSLAARINSAAAPSVGSFMSMANNLMKAPAKSGDVVNEDDVAGVDSSADRRISKSEFVSISHDGDQGSDQRPNDGSYNMSDTIDLSQHAPSATVVPTPAPAVPAAGAASYFGGFGKKMSSFGASSFESVRSNIAAAQLAHQQQQELQKQQQPPVVEKGSVLWSPDVTIPVPVIKAPEGGMGFMLGLRTAIVSKINTARGTGTGAVAGTGTGAPEDKVVVPLAHSNPTSTFVIDEEDEGDEDDGMGPKDDVDPHKICVSKTDLERTQVINGPIFTIEML
jgi:hypothetical protein